MADTDRVQQEALRFERFPTIDVALWPHCVCWVAIGGPFLRHEAGCLCPCHNPAGIRA